MKHASTRDLYDYWNDSRGTRLAPERAEIDPTDIRHVLADTFLLGSHPAGDLAVRLAGTRVCALFCRELKGEDFTGLFSHGSRGQIDDLIGIVRNELMATIAGVIAHTDDGSAAELELLLLPLRHHGRTDTRMIGVLAPVTPPYWLGSISVAALSLGSLRHTGLTDEPAGASPLPLPHRAGRLLHGFVVYDGGRR